MEVVVDRRGFFGHVAGLALGGGHAGKPKTSPSSLSPARAPHDLGASSGSEGEWEYGAGLSYVAAGVVRVFGHPLTNVANFCETLEKLLSRFPGAGEAVGPYMTMIQEEVFSCMLVMESLRTLGLEYREPREPTDLGELIRGVLYTATHLENSRGREIVFDRPDPLVVRTNVLEIRSVVFNLVVNALDNMDPGDTLTVMLKRREATAEVRFMDNGSGMSSDTLGKVFLPFYSHDPNGKNVGLGLPISRQFVSRHGGEIRAESSGPGRGSTFTLLLPLSPGDRAGRPASAAGNSGGENEEK